MKLNTPRSKNPNIESIETSVVDSPSTYAIRRRRSSLQREEFEDGLGTPDKSGISETATLLPQGTPGRPRSHSHPIEDEGPAPPLTRSAIVATRPRSREIQITPILNSCWISLISATICA